MNIASIPIAKAVPRTMTTRAVLSLSITTPSMNTKMNITNTVTIVSVSVIINPLLRTYRSLHRRRDQHEEQCEHEVLVRR